MMMVIPGDIVVVIATIVQSVRVVVVFEFRKCAVSSFRLEAWWLRIDICTVEADVAHEVARRGTWSDPTLSKTHQ